MLFHNPTVDDREAILILSKRDDLTEYEENALQSLDERDIWPRMLEKNRPRGLRRLPTTVGRAEIT